MENLESVLRNLGVGRRPVNDPFFANSHKWCKVFERKGVTVEDEEELCHEIMKKFPCNACNATFENLLDYELHYHDSHHFVCAQCEKWRPTNRLLEIHVQETHDSFFKVLAERQPMYQCFVSECDIKFKDPAERREHCRQVHEFPKNYRFDNLTHTKTKKSSNKDTAMETGENESCKKKDTKIYFGKGGAQKKAFLKQNFDLNLVDSTKNDSKIEVKMAPVTMFIPRQVQQKVYAKSLTKNQQMERNVLESESIMELGEALPSS